MEPRGAGPLTDFLCLLEEGLEIVGGKLRRLVEILELFYYFLN